MEKSAQGKAPRGKSGGKVKFDTARDGKRQWQKCPEQIALDPKRKLCAGGLLDNTLTSSPLTKQGSTTKSRSKFYGIKYAAEIADLKSLIELNIQKCWYELNRLNRYIASLEDPLIRQIMSLRCVNGLPREQVAASVGGGNTANGMRKKLHTYLENH